ncbi:polyprenyl synthetase family protein [Nocardia stercoris]|uniref:Polyprenyl synthetase family protein n=1 Tax=Nocardia stercoris TaxID=2483361 RepID=A0A3M2L598_9NOCA|nr:class 1 isoprenoid biosynthesis enzyme [Nocardia stercoris]RMI32126.1 hypothetical protein EBN03_14000 [Nocardia stercoris]
MEPNEPPSPEQPAVRMPPAYPELSAAQTRVVEQTIRCVDEICRRHPQLGSAVIRLLRTDYKNSSIHRLLPVPILGALTGETDPALPLCVLSRLWWTGADIFDDLNDGHFDPTRVGLSPGQATIAAVACMGLLPSALVAQQVTQPTAVRNAWIEQIADANLDAADSQLADISSAVDAGSVTDVLRNYAGRSGSACARDVAMTAELAGVTAAEVPLWREFGRRFGVLRQLANDRKSLLRDVRDDEDLANGTRTLLLAHALEGSTAQGRDEIHRVSDRARTDLAARAVLRDVLTHPDTTERYDAHVVEIGRQLKSTLVDLAAPSRHRAAVEWMIDESVVTAVCSVRIPT